MQQNSAGPGRMFWTLLIATSFTACASRPLPVIPEIAPPPASLLRSDSPLVEAHSLKVQALLQKVRLLLESWKPKPPGCATTRPDSGACL